MNCREKLIRNIIRQSPGYKSFKKIYTSGAMQSPARDEIYIELASKTNYFEEAKKLIIGYWDWGKETNQRIIDFAKKIKRDD